MSHLMVSCGADAPSSGLAHYYLVCIRRAGRF